jgi:hypothetical protein
MPYTEQVGDHSLEEDLPFNHYAEATEAKLDWVCTAENDGQT